MNFVVKIILYLKKICLQLIIKPKWPIQQDTLLP